MSARNNRNWQDKMLGGAILTGFVVIAVIAALFALTTLNNDERKVDTPALSHAYGRCTRCPHEERGVSPPSCPRSIA